jgi:succinoglycan biosynthesis protein ExoW
MLESKTTVAVIIPYYQKKVGILRRSLNSILAQKLPPDVLIDIIVIDDGSPISARQEIKDIEITSPFRLVLKEQPNGGVAKARNSGLELLSEETLYISFIDSDDIWDPNHLETALAALNNGADFYFCDHKRIGVEAHNSQLELVSFKLLPMTEMPIDKYSGIYTIKKNIFFDFMLRNFICQISTVVYKKDIARDVNFNTYLHAAGEDDLFLMQIVSKANLISCYPKVQVTCADGVNIWVSRSSWDSPAHTISKLCQILSVQEMKKSINFSKDNTVFLTSRIKGYRKIFAFLTIRELFKKRRFLSKHILSLTRNDPKFWIWYPLNIVYVCVFYPLRLYSPLKQ